MDTNAINYLINYLIKPFLVVLPVIFSFPWLEHLTAPGENDAPKLHHNHEQTHKRDYAENAPRVHTPRQNDVKNAPCENWTLMVGGGAAGGQKLQKSDGHFGKFMVKLYLNNGFNGLMV